MSNDMSLGQNEWLVDEIYQQLQKGPQSMGQEQRELLAVHIPFQRGEDLSDVTKPAAATEEEAKAVGRRGSKGVEPTKTPNKSASPKPKKSPIDTIAKISAIESGEEPLKGVARAVAKSMNISLEVPTAASVHDMPACLMFENRTLVNNHLARACGGKIPFTHIISYAMVKTVMLYLDMNNNYKVADGESALVIPEYISLDLTIDIPAKDGSRSPVVAAVREYEALTFKQFADTYEDTVARARHGELAGKDFQGVVISLTNPDGTGTRHPIPRLAKGQGATIGVGSIDCPVEFAGVSTDRLTGMGIGGLVTITSIYDRHTIQGTESGEFLRTMSNLFVDDKFWDHIFQTMRVFYTPIRWTQDLPNTDIDKNIHVMHLIEAYRSRDHLLADIDPLRYDQPNTSASNHADLDIQEHGLTLWDLDYTFNIGGLSGKGKMTLCEVLSRLCNAYRLRVGSEYARTPGREEREQLEERIEGGQLKPSHAEQRYILQKLDTAETSENFLQTKYVSQKRFSLEGAEAPTPLMDSAIDTATGTDLGEVVTGMPHRGQPSVLANIVGKPLRQIFAEFEGNTDLTQVGGSGDVRYHPGATGRHIQMSGEGETNVTPTANPSYLEAVNPIVEGLARTRQDRINKDEEGYSVIPLLLHGDASFAGLGTVQGTLNLMSLCGYKVGEAVHIVVNNQIGFATLPDSGRSSYYATDIAKTYGYPVFHTNGNDPEAVVWVGQLAVEYRNRYDKDVFIDLVYYRKRSHNEVDDPSMTQPLMYRTIDGEESARAQYTEDLIGRGGISEEEHEAVRHDFHDQMEAVSNKVRVAQDIKPGDQLGIAGPQLLPHGLKISVGRAEVIEIGYTCVNVPGGFKVHPRAAPVARRHAQMTQEGSIDWGMAELLAIGSFTDTGIDVHFTGEDVRRGTSTFRHAVLIDAEDGSECNLTDAYGKSKNGGRFMIYNSALTEYAGMGFKYGYTLSSPDAAVFWEVQFGDFANGVQATTDQYVSSGEAKWGQTSELVLLLPHDYKGVGLDHSPVRIERFLQLAAEGSYTVARPSEPANCFHLLCRHIPSDLRHLLVVFLPKSTLCNKLAVSGIKDFTGDTKFRVIIDGPHFASKDKPGIKVLLLCFGKIYWDLEKKCKKDKRDNIVTAHLEMLHPLPHNRLRDLFESYPDLQEVRWVRGESTSQGPWPSLALNLSEVLPDMSKLTCTSRRVQSSITTDVTKVHQTEGRVLLGEVLKQVSSAGLTS